MLATTCTVGVRVERGVRLAVRTGAACCLMLVGVAGHAGSLEPAEPYRVRPNILQVEPRTHSLLPSWDSTKRGVLDTVAFRLEVYPEHELCFLARDGEVFSDAAMLATADHDRDRARVRLLNVSSASSQSKNLRQYLRQEGIFSRLRAGKKILFVDTGFTGSLAATIRNLVPKEQRGQIATHLIVSHNASIPSLRVYGSVMNPKHASFPSFMMGAALVPIELRAKFTKPAVGYERVDGKWEPVSPLSNAADDFISGDSSVSPARALEYMEDLAAHFQDPSNRAHLEHRRTVLKKLVLLARSSPQRLADELRRMMKSAPDDPFPESVARDFVDAQSTNRVFGPDPKKLKLKSFGLSEWVDGSSTALSTPELVARHPNWKTLLERPKQGIAKLAAQGRLHELGDVLAITDSTTYLLEVTSALGKQRWDPAMEKLAAILIDKNDESVNQAVAFSLLSKREASRGLVELLMSRTQGLTMNALAAHVFSAPHDDDLTQLAKLFIQRARHSTALMHFAEHALGWPELPHRDELVRLTMEKGDANVQSIVERQVLRARATKEPKLTDSASSHRRALVSRVPTGAPNRPITRIGASR